MPARAASSSTSVMVTPPKKKKIKTGFFGCRSKNALDSLPRNARGADAAIHRLQAKQLFPSESSNASTPFNEEKPKHEPSFTAHTPQTDADVVVEKQDDRIPDHIINVPVMSHLIGVALTTPSEDELDVENDEARDQVPEQVPTRPSTPGPLRALSLSSRKEPSSTSSTPASGGKIKRSLSLKRSGSTASTSLIQRAPPVSSADFADLPPSTSSESVEAQLGNHAKIGSSESSVAVAAGDFASIRQARGNHQSSYTPSSRHIVFPDISEDEYLNLKDVPVPPSLVPASNDPTLSEGEQDARTQDTIQRRAIATSLPSSMRDSDSMKAVAQVLEDSTDTYRFHSGPSTGTPQRMESPAPNRTPSVATIHRHEHSHEREGSQDTLSQLPSSPPYRNQSFWQSNEDQMAQEEMSGFDPYASPSRVIPFQYVTNLSRPVSIASLRSLARPETPQRTSSLRGSPRSPASNVRHQRSYNILKSKGTFNGFPASYFPGSTPTSLKHSQSVTSHNSSSRAGTKVYRKEVPDPIPALEFEAEHKRRLSRSQSQSSQPPSRRKEGPTKLEQSTEEEGEMGLEGDENEDAATPDTSMEDVENQLGAAAASPGNRDFASFVAKGKASRRTTITKKPLSKSNHDQQNQQPEQVQVGTIGEGTMKKWGLAEAFKAAAEQADAHVASLSLKPNGSNETSLKPPKKMVPGPAGAYITDTANLRWCNALDEIKKALADDEQRQQELEQEQQQFQDTQSALRHADAVLSKLGIET